MGHQVAQPCVLGGWSIQHGDDLLPCGGIKLDASCVQQGILGLLERGIADKVGNRLVRLLRGPLDERALRSFDTEQAQRIVAPVVEGVRVALLFGQASGVVDGDGAGGVDEQLATRAELFSAQTHRRDCRPPGSGPFRLTGVSCGKDGVVREQLEPARDQFASGSRAKKSRASRLLMSITTSARWRDRSHDLVRLPGEGQVVGLAGGGVCVEVRRVRPLDRWDLCYQTIAASDRQTMPPPTSCPVHFPNLAARAPAAGQRRLAGALRPPAVVVVEPSSIRVS